MLSDGEGTLCLENGSPYMVKVTGTGGIIFCFTVFLGKREFYTFDEGSYEIDMKLPNFIIIYSCNNNFIMV